MVEEKYTRCPACRTVFRVTPAQLALRAGQVRCGSCRNVFDGTACLIQLAPVAAFAAPPDDEALGPLTVTLRNAQALEPAVAPAPAAEPRAPEPPAPLTATQPASPEDTEVDYDRRFAWERPRLRSRRKTLLYAAAIVALALIFVGQLAWHYRDALAAHVPSTRPILTRACALANCTVGPLRQIAGLSIDASDLQADPAHKGLLTLTATVRNRASYPVAYPHLELTLTDAQDRAVVRRALAPADYAGGTANLDTGIPGNGEVAVKLFLDASATTQSGYRVYLFYP